MFSIQCPTVCATPISVMRFVIGQFPLRNGVLSTNDCYKLNPIGQWGKILVMAMGFVDHLGIDLNPGFGRNFGTYLKKFTNGTFKTL
jgi:hypothetical protein